MTIEIKTDMVVLKQDVEKAKKEFEGCDIEIEWENYNTVVLVIKDKGE